MAMKINSPYTAAITGGGFLLNETLALLPLLQSEDREELLKDERLNNRVLMINAETSRKKAILEISRRYDTMSPILISFKSSAEIVYSFPVSFSMTAVGRRSNIASTSGPE